jgi:hypothetical protein
MGMRLGTTDLRLMRIPSANSLTSPDHVPDIGSGRQRFAGERTPVLDVARSLKPFRPVPLDAGWLTVS